MCILRPLLLLAVLSSLCFSQVEFSSDFESGNIESVTATDSVTYTVKTRTDIGGRWFYFKMKGIKNKFVRLKISNSDVLRAMYSFDNLNFQRYTLQESPLRNTFEKTYTEDSVYVAYYTPYTLSCLNKRVSEWKANPMVSLDTIGYTKRNLPLYEIKVTDRSVPDSLKEHIWIHARTHPGETPSSWHFDGIMKTLLSNDDVINYYLKNLVFHCVPFTNPDGVFYGRSRTNFDYVDLESDWNRPDSASSREVVLLKQRMNSINLQKPFKVLLNLHSQAAQFCTFWIHTALSTSNLFYRKQLQFSNINISDIDYFKSSDFSYSNLSPVYPEGWQWKNWNDKTIALTYETPYDYYSTGSLVDSLNLAKLGERTVYSIAEYLQISHPKRVILNDPQTSLLWTKDSSGNDFFGNSFRFTSANSGAGDAVYSTSMIGKGKYDIYAWWPANSGNASDARVTLKGGGNVLEKVVDQRIDGAKWNLLGSLSLANSGEVVISVNGSGSSNKIVANAFRVIYSGIPVVSVEAELTSARSFELYQNYPNPFNSQTVIKFRIQNPENVKLNVFNSLGQLVNTLVDDYKSQGTYEVSFNAADLASGVYYFRLSAGDKMETKSMVLLK